VESIIRVSLVRGVFKPRRDIDVFIIINDTSEGKQEEIYRELREIAGKISERLLIHPPYTLAEFKKYVEEESEMVYYIIKYGIVVHDTGFFKDLKKRLESGEIPGTWEAVEKLMEVAVDSIREAKNMKLSILRDLCYDALLNSVQAVLMFTGLKSVKDLVEIGLLEEEYAEWVKEIVEVRGKIERSELLEVQGKVVDEWLERVEKFVEKALSQLEHAEILKRKIILKKTYEVMRKAVAQALIKLYGLSKGLSVSEVEEELGMSLAEAFKKLVDERKIDPYYYDLWVRVAGLKREVVDKGKDIAELRSDEIYWLREAVRKLITELDEMLEEEMRGSRG